jgi:hypothetical protein
MAIQFITIIDDFRNEAPSDREQGCSFKRFERLNILMFDGKQGPIEFGRMYRGIKGAIFSLPTVWWSQTMVECQEGATNPRTGKWNGNLLGTISKRFLQQYFPKILRDARVWKFLDLT